MRVCGLIVFPVGSWALKAIAYGINDFISEPWYNFSRGRYEQVMAVLFCSCVGGVTI